MTNFVFLPMDEEGLASFSGGGGLFMAMLESIFAEDEETVTQLSSLDFGRHNPGPPNNSGEIVRVRQLIPYIVSELEGKQLLPAKMFTAKYPAVKYPKFITKNKLYSEFGLALEAQVLLKLTEKYTLISQSFNRNVKGDVNVSARKQSPHIDTSYSSILTHMDDNERKDLETSLKKIERYFIRRYPAAKIFPIINSEWSVEVCPKTDDIQKTDRKVCLVGHPDLVLDLGEKRVAIFDVKVFARMTGASKEQKGIRIQLSLYAALACKLGYEVVSLGVIMPWQREDPVVEYPMAEYPMTKLSKRVTTGIATGITTGITTGIIDPWKSFERFWQVSIDVIPRALDTPKLCRLWSQRLSQYGVGSHIEFTQVASIMKDEDRGYITHIPFQLFLYGNVNLGIGSRGGDDKKSVRTKFFKGVGSAKGETPRYNFSKYRAFVHAPYSLNLAKTDAYVLKSAIQYMEDSAKLGFRGVVFHVGHSSVTGETRDAETSATDAETSATDAETSATDVAGAARDGVDDDETGVKQMKINIDKILKHTSASCPFLLETPCGSGNELLTTPESLSKFALSFPSDKFGLCLDTCHVFVSGYMPTEYLAKLDRAEPRIALIHFNGSRKKLGCCADGHAHVCNVGTQNIPDGELMGILNYAKEWDISCVTE